MSAWRDKDITLLQLKYSTKYNYVKNLKAEKLTGFTASRSQSKMIPRITIPR